MEATSTLSANADARKPDDARKSWHDTIKVHPAADRVPMMSEDELRVLGEDIKKNGLQNQIVIWRKPEGLKYPANPDNYLLLDGRNRLAAMELVGIPFELTFASRGRGRRQWRLRLLETDDVTLDVPIVLDDPIRLELGDPYKFVLSLNVHRRHLTGEQKHELIVKLLKATPEKSNRQIAKTVGASHPHVAKVREELEKAGD